MNNNGITKGYLIYFKENRENEAYEIISKTEHKALYQWKQVTMNNIDLNVLIGIKPKVGSSIPEVDRVEFKGENDPFFREAIELIEENLKNISIDFKPRDNFKESIKNFLTLQMTYMLLWSAIDRYTSLKYNLKTKGDNNRAFANESAFKEALEKYVNNSRRIYSAEDMAVHFLNKKNPESSIKYYYTIRCNVVHRGKELMTDKKILTDSLTELLNIFKYVLDSNFH